MPSASMSSSPNRGPRRARFRLRCRGRVPRGDMSRFVTGSTVHSTAARGPPADGRRRKTAASHCERSAGARCACFRRDAGGMLGVWRDAVVLADEPATNRWDGRPSRLTPRIAGELVPAKSIHRSSAYADVRCAVVRRISPDALNASTRGCVTARHASSVCGGSRIRALESCRRTGRARCRRRLARDRVDAAGPPRAHADDSHDLMKMCRRLWTDDVVENTASLRFRTGPSSRSRVQHPLPIAVGGESTTAMRGPRVSMGGWPQAHAESAMPVVASTRGRSVRARRSPRHGVDGRRVPR